MFRQLWLEHNPYAAVQCQGWRIIDLTVCNNSNVLFRKPAIYQKPLYSESALKRQFLVVRLAAFLA